MQVIGESGDVSNFSDFAQRNMSLYKMRNGYELSPRATHFWLRKYIADALRSENYWRVDVLLGGYDDKENKAWLSSIDYLGNGIEEQVRFSRRLFPQIFSLWKFRVETWSSSESNLLNFQNYLFRGFPGRFCYAILDTLYHPGMTQEEGIAAVKRCINESRSRFVANLPDFNVMIIDKDGSRVLDQVL